MILNKVEKKQKKVLSSLKSPVSKEEFEAAVEKAYRKNVGRFNVPGFRKASPAQIIEKLYGRGIFFRGCYQLELSGCV